jgi:hypothetical protein
MEYQSLEDVSVNLLGILDEVFRACETQFGNQTLFHAKIELRFHFCGASYMSCPCGSHNDTEAH